MLCSCMMGEQRVLLFLRPFQAVQDLLARGAGTRTGRKRRTWNLRALMRLSTTISDRVSTNKSNVKEGQTARISPPPPRVSVVVILLAWQTGQKSTRTATTSVSDTTQ